MRLQKFYAFGILFFVLSVATMPVLANSLLDEGLQISSGQFEAYSFSGTKGVSISVNFKINSGGAVNLLLMDSGNFTLFSSDCSNGGSSPFYYYGSGSALSTMSKSYSFTLPSTQSYYVVIDNAGCVAGGASPSGSVNFHITITSQSSNSGYELPVALIAILIVSVTFLGFALYLKSRK